MKTIGLIGGMSWESTIPYYRQINEIVKARLGGLHSAKIILYSVDFHEIAQLQQADDWEEAGEVLACAARALEIAGAEMLLIGANTMHRVAPAVVDAISIPLLHVVDVTASTIKQAGHSRVGLIGTRFTMEQPFYREHLQQHGLDVLVPDAADQDSIHRIIFEELCLGVVRDESRQIYRAIMNQLVEQGAQAIILGCTEVAMLVSPEDSAVPLFDTTSIHARAAAELALKD